MTIGPDYPNVYLYRRMVQAKLYIDQNYHLQIDLEMIADEACFSKFHFIRLFSKIYRYTPHQYLIRTRVRNAELLLKEGVSVAEVCYSVGFESISSFTGLFKKITGNTPAAYQLQEQARKAATLERPLQFIPGCFGLVNSNYQEAEV